MIQATITVDASPTPTPQSNDDGNPNLGAIIGGTVGGVVAATAISLTIIFVLRKKRQGKAAGLSGHELSNGDDKAELPWQERHELPVSGDRSPVEVEAKHGRSEANNSEIYEILG